MFAGSGFDGAAGKPGGAGGSVSNVVIASALIAQGDPASTPSYEILAGDGGSGTHGGAGGAVTHIVDKSSTGVVKITAGKGGGGSTGAGGAGGSVTGLDMQSDSSSYTVLAGKGGSGAPGGAGGSLQNNNFSGKAPSTGLVVSADFTGDGIDDVLVIDSGTGKMVVERNNGNGSAFAPVVQDDRNTGDPSDDIIQIDGKGTTPSSVIAADVNGDGLPDIVVAYKNSNSLGVYLNNGGGVFYDQHFTNGVYTGSTLTGSTVDLGFSPTKVVAGNFTGSADIDLAVLKSDNASSELHLAAGDGTGKFGLSDTSLALPRLATDMIAASIKGGSYLDLFVGFRTGTIASLLSTGAATGAAFTLGGKAAVLTGGVGNLDIDAGTHRLLALNVTQTALGLYGFDSTGALSSIIGPDLSKQTGKPLVARFVADPNSAEAPIEVLSTLVAGSRLDEYTSQNGVFSVAATVQSASTLKNFVPVIEGVSHGDAALGGSLGHFSFSQSEGAFTDFALPFAGKKVGLTAGDGGDGIDPSAKVFGKGGAGGAIAGVNIEAGDIFLQAGNGGNSSHGAAGAGGSITNSQAPALDANGVPIPSTAALVLDADTSLVLHAGDGGASSAASAFASGGNGGSIAGFKLSLTSGDIDVSAGAGGAGHGGAGGTGGGVVNLITTAMDGSLLVGAGGGGDATSGAARAGAGGSVVNVNHTLTLSPLTEQLEKAYTVDLAAGAGGKSAAGIGGAGGSVSATALKLDPADESVDNPTTPLDEHTTNDSTVRVNLAAGAGGNGALGGAGGAITSVKSVTVFDQFVTDPVSHGRYLKLNPVTMQLTAGDGGKGLTGAGGAGGSVTPGAASISGLTTFDTDLVGPQKDPLRILAGTGGDGATRGGAGGSIATILTSNALAADGGAVTSTQLHGATLIAGSGGKGGTSDGGRGGNVSGAKIAVEQGSLTIHSGDGGKGGSAPGAVAGRGGAAGNILASTVGVVDSFGSYGILLGSGKGGAASREAAREAAFFPSA